MEPYERKANDERLVNLINNVNELNGESKDIAEWIDCIPEITELCIFMLSETGDPKYADILKTTLEGLDGIMQELSQKCDISQKEQYGIMRLRLNKLMRNIKD